MDAGAAASGMARSGAALQAEQQFGSGLANTTFGNYFNQLQQLSGNGLTAAGGIANAATGGAASRSPGSIPARLVWTPVSTATSPRASALAPISCSEQRGAELPGGGGGSGAPQMTGFAPAMVPGQVGVGGIYSRL